MRAAKPRHRETQILQMVHRNGGIGCTLQWISQQLGIARGAVAVHLHHLCRQGRVHRMSWDGEGGNWVRYVFGPQPAEDDLELEETPWLTTHTAQNLSSHAGEPLRASAG